MSRRLLAWIVFWVALAMLASFLAQHGLALWRNLRPYLRRRDDTS